MAITGSRPSSARAAWVLCTARDERLERDVALKVLVPGTMANEAARRRFRKEAVVLSQLNHPNIATIHDFDTQDGVDFIVLELIPGNTLGELVASGPFCPISSSRYNS